MRVRLFIPIFVLAAASSLAQVNPGHARCTIRVDVFYASGGHAPARLRVQLMQEMSGAPVAVTVTNTSGVAEFTDVDSGRYRVVVSGDGIETSDTGTIDVSDWDVFRSQTISIKTTN